MKLLKRWLWMLTVSMLICAGLTVSVSAAEEVSLEISSTGALRGDTVTVEVTLTGGNAVAGGNIEIGYDTTYLELNSVETGSILSGALTTLNTKYTSDSMRLGFAASSTLSGDGVLCTLTFKIRSDAPLGTTLVTFNNANLYDGDIENCLVATNNGTVSVQYAALSVVSTEAVRGQSVQVTIQIDGELDPAGGSFSICYDTDMLDAGSVTAGSLLNGYALVSSEATSGVLQVSWAGSEVLQERGMLCTVSFHILQTASEDDTEISIENLHFYDESGVEMDCIAENGTITLLTASEDSPKLWIVGGSIDPDTSTAAVNVVAEERGAVCGGGFTLCYPEGCILVSAVSNIGAGVINDTESGQVMFSWADATSQVGSVELLQLTFRVDDPLQSYELSLENVGTYDGEGQTVTMVDIRCGKLLPGALSYQISALDDAYVVSSDSNTLVDVVLDIAASDSSVNGKEDGAQLFLALYENDKLVTAYRRALEISMDENGIAQAAVSAALAGTGDTLGVFLLKTDGSMVPMAEMYVYVLE